MLTVEQSPGNRFNLLRSNDELISSNLGGKYSLPAEFDTTKHVGGFYQTGQEALSMEGDQHILGSQYWAPGWTVWKYPPTRPDGSEHPMAGKAHKIAGTKEGENFVLMFRDVSVQQQVNDVYAGLSTEMLVAEQRGETLAVGGDDPGMLSNQRLNKELGVEREIEEAAGRTTSLHAGVPSGTRITPKRNKVKR